MNSSELKARAKELLVGKKKDAAVMVFVMFIILLIVSGVITAIFPGKTETKYLGGMQYEVTHSNPIASLLLLVVTVFLSLGENSYFMKIARGEEPELNDLFSKGNLVLKVFVTSLLVALVVCLGYIALIIPGIILSFAYSMYTLIYIDNPEIGIIESMKKSRLMMKGHKWEYFCLMISFLGWMILSVFTCGLLLFWLLPYIGVTTILFYDSIREENAKEPQETE